MHYLSTPTDETAKAFDAGTIFETCVAMVKKPALRTKLRGIRTDVESAAKEYERLAKKGELYKKKQHAGHGSVSTAELVGVYTLRMVPPKSTGRPIYDRILALPVNRKCPFCGIGTVNTLDHFLPKTLFPLFSVTPNNLVPACKWCQGEKLEYFAEESDEQLLHPYFDDLDGDIWLAAQLVEGNPVAFRYFVSPPDLWSETNKKRVATHLRKLKLAPLFAANAGSRFLEMRFLLEKLVRGGEAEVRSYLQGELESVEKIHKNSWVSAMFRATLASDWLCRGEFIIS